MKSYLYFVIFFLPILGISQFVSAEEERLIQTPKNSLSTDQQGSSGFTRYPEYGELPTVGKEGMERESDTFQAKFMNMLFLLALLIGFMILASWALKRMMKSKLTQLNTASNIKIMETRYLSPRATLYLVEVENKAILIAESPTCVTYLATLPANEEQPSPTMATVSPPSFPKIS